MDAMVVREAVRAVLVNVIVVDDSGGRAGESDHGAAVRVGVEPGKGVLEDRVGRDVQKQHVYAEHGGHEGEKDLPGLGAAVQQQHDPDDPEAGHHDGKHGGVLDAFFGRVNSVLDGLLLGEHRNRRPLPNRLLLLEHPVEFLCKPAQVLAGQHKQDQVHHERQHGGDGERPHDLLSQPRRDAIVAVRRHPTGHGPHHNEKGDRDSNPNVKRQRPPPRGLRELGVSKTTKDLLGVARAACA